MLARRPLALSAAAFAALTVAASQEACGSGDDSSSNDVPVDGGADGTTGNDAASENDGSISDDAGGDAARPLGPPRVYVGADDGKIRVYAFDTQSYALTPIGATNAGTNPSFLAFDPAHHFLYAIDEGGSTVRGFSIDQKTGALTAVGSPVSSGGSGPAHVSVDRSGRFVLVANYGGGTAAIFPRAGDGSLGAASANPSFGGGALTHEIVADPTNRFLFVANKGLSAIALLRFGDGGVTDAGLVPAGNGARHVDFSPDGRHAYVVDENASAVVAFSFDPQSGALTSLGSVSTLDPSFSGSNTGAEIQVTRDGAHVLASNRGDDSLAIFDVNASDGKLTRKARVATLGTTPRQFRIDETGRFLFVGNQGSKTVVTMTVDASTGVPTAVGSPLTLAGAPEFVALMYLDAP